MKKKGFTLIELLAVIVILAIIALIATPIVLDIIEDSKVNSIKRSSELYLDGVEQAVARYQLNGKTLSNGTYYIMKNGNICTNPLSDDKCTGEEITVTVDGTKPNSGTITIKDGEIEKGGFVLNIENNIIAGKEEMKILDFKNYICAKVSGNNYEIGSKYICDLGDSDLKTFYVLEDGDTTTLTEGRIASVGEVSLIMDINIDSNGKGKIGSTTAWISEEDYKAAGGEDLHNDWGSCTYVYNCAKNQYGPITANNYLTNSTTNWSKLSKEQVSLPTAYQIATSLGQIFNDAKLSDLPLWLYENLGNGSRGYWTSTPNSSYLYSAWGVDKDGEISTTGVGYSSIFSSSHTGGYVGGFGVRPVITISKSQLN